MTRRFSYSIGDMVRIKAGPFQNFTARVEEVDDVNATVKVRVKIFGRTQPVELRTIDVEKIEFTEEE